MTSDIGLSRFQIDVAQLFFSLPASSDYAIAGGAGLIANDLISRPTHDLDLFAHAPTRTVVRASSQFLMAAAKMGWTVTALMDTPTFCRVPVLGPDDDVLVDLAIDSPPMHAPALTILGPTLMPLDRFADDEIPLPPHLVREVRAFFAAWREELRHSP